MIDGLPSQTLDMHAFTQHVVGDGVKSKTAPVVSGVHQGTASAQNHFN